MKKLLFLAKPFLFLSGGFIVAIVVCFIFEKIQEKSFAELSHDYLTKNGTDTEPDSIKERKNFLYKFGSKYIYNLFLYFTLSLIAVIGLYIFLLMSSSTPGYSGWFVALYVIVGAAADNLYNTYPVPHSPACKTGSPGNLARFL